MTKLQAQDGIRPMFLEWLYLRTYLLLDVVLSIGDLVGVDVRLL